MPGSSTRPSAGGNKRGNKRLSEVGRSQLRRMLASKDPRIRYVSPVDPHIVGGVIDTGVADVPDLAGKVDQPWTFAPDGTPTAHGCEG